MRPRHSNIRLLATLSLWALLLPAFAPQDPVKPPPLVAEDAPAEPKADPPPAPELHGWAQELKRAGTRLVYYRSTEPEAWDQSPGHVAITYSVVSWREDYEKSVEKLLQGGAGVPEAQRWRLGKNLWTTLDARLPLTIGGTKIPPGYYYLALCFDQTDEDAPFHLCVLDPSEMATQQVDAWHLDKREVPVASRIPLKFERTQDDASKEKLSVLFLIEPDDSTRAELRIEFGKYIVTAPVAVEVE